MDMKLNNQINSPHKFVEEESVKQVIEIPAVILKEENQGQSWKGTTTKRLNIAAYCRVSTNDEHQQTSYHLQVDYYTKFIQKHKEWKLYKIFADEGITGTSMKKRERFNEMMKDAMEGKIDYIITKSISRFARNTVDTLNCVRKLKQLKPPVGIYFEKENIDTLDEKSELILTILSALAQDESRSNSDNVKWSLQKRFQQGIPFVNLKRMIGYDEGPDGEWLINEEQAETVRFIFNSYIAGMAGREIARQLMEQGRKTGWGGHNWAVNGIYRILRNEKMVGDLLLQKTVTEDFLTHKSIPNDGRCQSYYIKDHHVGIIDRETWNEVQEEMDRRRRATGISHKKKQDIDKDEKDQSQQKKRIGSHSASKIAAFADVLYCGQCGSGLSRKVYTMKAHNYDKNVPAEQKPGKGQYYKCTYPVWKCKMETGNDAQKCREISIHEAVLEQSFMELLYSIRKDFIDEKENSWISKEFQKVCDREIKKSTGNTILEKRKNLLRMQITDLMKKLEKDNVPEQADRQEINIQLENRRQEYDRLEREAYGADRVKRHYGWFIEMLEALPDTNPDGSLINFFGGTKDRLSSGENTFDFLPFREDIFKRLVKKAKIVDGVKILYETAMSIGLTAAGLDRSLHSFLGYRKVRADGVVEYLTETYQVANRPVSLYSGRKKVD